MICFAILFPASLFLLSLASQLTDESHSCQGTFSPGYLAFLPLDTLTIVAFAYHGGFKTLKVSRKKRQGRCNSVQPLPLPCSHGNTDECRSLLALAIWNHKSAHVRGTMDGKGVLRGTSRTSPRQNTKKSPCIAEEKSPPREISSSIFRCVLHKHLIGLSYYYLVGHSVYAHPSPPQFSR